jgi:hypothetical protein
MAGTSLASRCLSAALGLERKPDHGPRSGTGADFQLRSNVAGALVHQAETEMQPAGVGWVKATPVVGDLSLESTSLSSNRQPNGPSFRVMDGVDECFPCYLVHDQFALRS